MEFQNATELVEWWENTNSVDDIPRSVSIDETVEMAGVGTDTNHGDLHVDISVEYGDRESVDSEENPDPDPVDSVPFDDTIADRDERIEHYGGSHDHQKIREYLRSSGIAERIQDRLADLFEGQNMSQALDRSRQDIGMFGGVPEMRQVVRRFAGDLRIRDVFRSDSPGIDDDLAVCVVLDCSMSMGGQSEFDAKAAAGAFLFGVQLFGGEVVAMCFQPNRLITAPVEPFRWAHLDAAYISGGTPTSQAIAAGAQLLEQTSSPRKLMFVLTDGRANNIFKTQQTVDAIRERGDDWMVIGFGFGNISERQLKIQFGETGCRHVDLDELPDAMVDAYQEQHQSVT